MYKSFAFVTFIKRLRAHPGYRLADHNFIAEAEAYTAYCFASSSCLQRYRHASRVHAQQWNVYDSSIGLRQCKKLLCRGALCALLVQRLMCFQGQYGVRKVLHHVCCVISRRHFLVSKNAVETLFEEGRRLYGGQQYREAVKSWAQAALLQHAPSHAFLSSLLFEGRADVPKDEQRAFEFAGGGVALGCTHSKGALGRCLVNGADIAKDVERGLALAKESADAGSSFGQFVVGICCFKGNVVSIDKTEARKWFLFAAAQGHAVAQCSLGFMFENGQGVAQDYDEAIRWYHLSATQGYAQAQVRLGNMFRYGYGIAQNNAEAVRWYRLAATQGNSCGQIILGFMLEYGEGVVKNHAKTEE